MVTADDLQMLWWLGRQRHASALQMARWSGRSEKVVYRRLGALRGLDLVAYERPTIGRGVYVVTRAGLRLVGLELPPSTVDIRCFHHDRGVVDLAVDFEADGERLVTEREMRHHDETARRDGERSARYGIRLPAAVHDGLHYPDLLILPTSSDADGGGVVAVEVERTAKNRARLERILTGYARARHIAGVRYYVPGARVGEHVNRVARAVGADPYVSVICWDGWGALPEAHSA